MKTRAIVVALCLPLSGCGPTIGTNSERPAISATLARPEVQPVETAAIVETGPAVSANAKRVFGTSCKNKAWDPAPSEENALNLMKRQAAEMGFNAVHSVTVKNDGRALAMNCWSAITATGIGFSIPSS